MHGNSVLRPKQLQSFKQSNISDTQAQGLSIELSWQDLLCFHDFQRAETQFKAANKLFRKRDRNLEDELND